MQREKPYLVLTSSEFYRNVKVLSRALRQVLHGCRQLVLWNVGLSPVTSATLILCCHQVKLGTQRRLPVINWRKVGTTSSHHGPYDQGYTRATMAYTKSSKLVKVSESHKVRLNSDWSLQLDFMKLESLVIVNQHVTVNTFSGLVHTARHTMEVCCKRNELFNPL